MLEKIQKGLTIFELVLVLIVLGTLSAIAIPNMFSFDTSQREAENWANRLEAENTRNVRHCRSGDGDECVEVSACNDGLLDEFGIRDELPSDVGIDNGSRDEYDEWDTITCELKSDEVEDAEFDLTFATLAHEPDLSYAAVS